LIRDNRKLEERVSDTIEQNRDKGLKGVRKDAVRMIEGTVQLSGKILDEPEAKQVEVLKDSFEYLQNQFGKENFVTGVIHLDETHPHLHFDFVPIENKKLTAKTIISPKRLKKYQSDFLKHLQDTEPVLNFKRGTGEFGGLSQADFERLTAKAAEMKQQQEEREEELDKREDKLDDREDEIDKREKDLERKEKTVQEQAEIARNNNLMNKKNAEKLNAYKRGLDIQERNIDERENEYQKNIKNFGTSVNQFKIKQVEQNEREKELKKHEDVLDIREKNIDENESKFHESIKNFNAGVKQVKAQQVKQKEHEKELRSRERDLKGRESSLETREREINQKDLEATEKLQEASRLQELAEKMMEQAKEQVEKAKKEIKAIKNRLTESWQRVIDMVRHGDLEPKKVEKTVKKYDPITTDKMEPLSLDLDDLSQSKNNGIQR
jgi:hypothetical protein